MENYSNEKMWIETFLVQNYGMNSDSKNENFINDGETLIYDPHPNKKEREQIAKKLLKEADTQEYEEYIDDMVEHYIGERNNTTKNLFDEVLFDDSALYTNKINVSKKDMEDKSSWPVSRFLKDGKIRTENELFLTSNYYYKKYHLLFNKLLNDMFFMINLFEASKAKELVKSESTSADYSEYNKFELFKDYSYLYEIIGKFIKHCKEHVIPKGAIYDKEKEWGKEGLFSAINKIFNCGMNLNDLGYYTYQIGNKAYTIFRKVYNKFLKEFVSFSDLFTKRMLEIISNYNSLLNALRMRIGVIQNSQKELADWLEKLNIYGSFNLNNFINLLKENKNFKNCLKKFLQFYEKIKNKEKLDKYENKYENLNEVLLKAKYFEYFKNNKIDFEFINNLIKICNQKNINSNNLNELINKCGETNNLNCLKELMKNFISDFMENYPKDVLNNTKNLFVKATIRPLREAIKAIESHFYEIVNFLNERDKLFSTYINDPLKSSEFKKKFENYNEKFLKKNEKQLNIISNNKKKQKKDDLVISYKLKNSNPGVELGKYLKEVREDVNSFIDGYDEVLVNIKDNKEDEKEKINPSFNVIEISKQEKAEEIPKGNEISLVQINDIVDDNSNKKKNNNNEIVDNLKNSNEVVEQKEDLKLKIKEDVKQEEKKEEKNEETKSEIDALLEEINATGNKKKGKNKKKNNK